MARDLTGASRATATPSLLALATGAAAFAAIAAGTLAIGYLAIGHLKIRKARFGTLAIDELTVRSLRLLDHESRTPGGNDQRGANL
jgi:hypothetical protein